MGKFSGLQWSSVNENNVNRDIGPIFDGVLSDYWAQAVWRSIYYLDNAEIARYTVL